jgi:Protein of unknown function (DUF 659)
MVRNHRKSEKVKSHLNSFPGLNLTMRGANSADLPVWSLSQGRSIASAKKGKKYTTQVSGASNTSYFQRSMRSFVLPNINKRDQEAVHKLLAMYYYMTGTPFVRIEERHLSDALQKLRPGATLPSRKDLACKYLNNCYDKVKGKVDAWLERDVYNCLTSDSWSNARNEAVINSMLVSAHTSLFLESNDTGDQGHSAAFLAADMSRVIDATPGKMAGAIMDNTTANKAAWVLLKRRHPHMFFQGCV